MGAQANASPVIIKRKKIVKGGGHHGGAWKVAYADFVTAMMAFFMLMWLLNATTEQQRKGIADYFSPTIPINRVSGGGTGAFGGDSIFSEDALPKSGTGGVASLALQTPGVEADEVSQHQTQQADALQALEERLMGQGGESLVMENAMRHVMTRLTDEGLVIELFDLEGIPLFEPGTDRPTQLLRDLAVIISATVRVVENGIAVGGHVATDPVVLAHSPVWEKSAIRGTEMRLLLQEAGIPPDRLRRVTGHADRDPVVRDTMAVRNNRIEVILLRDP